MHVLVIMAATSDADVKLQVLQRASFGFNALSACKITFKFSLVSN